MSHAPSKLLLLLLALNFLDLSIQQENLPVVIKITGLRQNTLMMVRDEFKVPCVRVILPHICEMLLQNMKIIKQLHSINVRKSDALWTSFRRKNYTNTQVVEIKAEVELDDIFATVNHFTEQAAVADGPIDYNGVIDANYILIQLLTYNLQTLSETVKSCRIGRLPALLLFHDELKNLTEEKNLTLRLHEVKIVCFTDESNLFVQINWVTPKYHGRLSAFFSDIRLPFMLGIVGIVIWLVLLSIDMKDTTEQPILREYTANHINSTDQPRE